VGASQTLAITVAGASTPPSDSSATSPTPATPVAQFYLSAVVFGVANRTAGADTTPARVAGAVITVYRLERAPASGGGTLDTLGTRVRVASATTDASGTVTFRGLAGGSSYLVSADPPAGSPYASGSLFFPPPTIAEMRVGFYLARKP
jgi:hypothetical protein